MDGMREDFNKQPTGCEAQLAAHLHSIFISFAWWQHRFDTVLVNL